jgi:hypothetical protein
MAYNPSNHLPISKPLGAGRFPIDGKMMFYTDGANGVYEYRPFVNVAEVLAYFPAGSDLRKGNFEILINEGGVLSPLGDSISGGTNSAWWFRDGIDDMDLVLKIQVSNSSANIPPYDPANPAFQNDVRSFFIDRTRYIFISQIDDNDSVPAFDNNTYQVAGVYKLPTVFSEADLIEESYGGVWYLPVDLNNRDIVSISINITGQTLTTYMDTSSVVTDSTWTPTTRISGFPSNDPQTITIKTI